VPALAGPSRAATRLPFENYSRIDSFLQQPARRPVGSRAGAARPVTTTVPAGTVRVTVQAMRAMLARWHCSPP
jgi:hypothetical protein